MRGKRGMKWTKSQTAMPLDGVTELPKAQVTIMRAVEEAILFLEGKEHFTLSEPQEKRRVHDNLVRALGDLRKLREALRRG